jgi:hypothetical protein
MVRGTVMRQVLEIQRLGAGRISNTVTDTRASKGKVERETRIITVNEHEHFAKRFEILTTCSKAILYLSVGV